MLLTKSISCFEYSCWAFLFPPDTRPKTADNLCIHPLVNCAMQIDIPYYGSDVGRAGKCRRCAGNNVFVSQKLKQRFKTVLPMGKLYLGNRKQRFTQSPYGKRQKWFWWWGEWAHWIVFMMSLLMYYALCFVHVEHSVCYEPISVYIYTYMHIYIF